MQCQHWCETPATQQAWWSHATRVQPVLWGLNKRINYSSTAYSLSLSGNLCALLRSLQSFCSGTPSSEITRCTQNSLASLPHFSQSQLLLFLLTQMSFCFSSHGQFCHTSLLFVLSKLHLVCKWSFWTCFWCGGSEFKVQFAPNTWLQV